MARFWTPERLRRLRVFAAEGLSMAEAGEKLGRTRNAIAGAAYRYDIPFNCSREHHSELASAGQVRRWERDDGTGRRAAAERMRQTMLAYWRDAGDRRA